MGLSIPLVGAMLSKSLKWLVAASLLVTLLGVPVSEAQVTGTISGYVKDPSGAAVPTVNITAVQVERQITRQAQANAEGFYNFVAMLPGTYEISFDAAGFQKLVRSGVKLTVNENIRVDAALTLGSVETLVNVEGAAPLVDTVSPTLSGLVDDRRVVDLPLNGRNIMSLARIMPGVLNVKAPQQLGDARGGPEMNVNGGRANMNLFTFNGGYFNNPSRNTGMNYPPPDAIQEVRILTHNFAPEYGRNPGSQVNVVSKAGTNDFHGSVWEFLRNDALNARSFFQPRVPAQKQNQFGFAAGAPLKKNNVFIFGSYQGLRDRREADTIEALVPSDAQRNGDFTGTGVTLTNPIDTLTGLPFRDAWVTLASWPIALQRAVSARLQKTCWVLSRNPPQGVSSLWRPAHGMEICGWRVDWNQSGKHTLNGTYYDDKNTRFNPFASGGNIPDYMSESFDQSTRHFTLSDTYSFSPTLLNQFTGTMLRTTSNQLQTETIDPTTLGINMPQYVPTGSVTVDVGGNFNLGSGFTTRFLNTNWQFRDSLNWIKGRHNFKFGYEFLHLNFRQIFIGSPGFTFNGARSGDPTADFLLGAFDSLSLNFGIRDTDVITDAHSAYFQDDFKISPRFTLTYGVRYEPFLPWRDRHDRINTVVVGQQSKAVPDAPLGILFPGDLPRGLADDDMNNFAPRVGFAWDVFGDGKTSVRGGYGIFFESINADSLAQENSPFAGFSNIFSGRIENPYGSLGLTAPPAATSGQFGCTKISAYPGYDCPLFPLPIGGVLTDISLRTPYVQSFNLSLQRQLTPTVMVEGSYAGKIGIKLPALRTYNPARYVNSPVDGSAPSDQNINDRVLFEPGILSPNGFLLGNDFRSWYHSFQAQVTKRFSGGVSILGSYSLAKSIDSSSTDNLGATVFNPFDLKQERGRSDWDRRHAMTVSWLWSPPMKFDSAVAKGLLGGWTFTGIHTIQSGAPLTFIMGDDVALDGTFGDQLALLKSGSTRDSIQINHSDRGAMVNQFFNTDAFVPTNQVQRGIYGNAGRGLISGPALNSSDFSIIKDFLFREPYKLQFRSEFFNAFNQVNFTSVGTSVTSGAFGRVRAASEGRIIQFALKFLW